MRLIENSFPFVGIGNSNHVTGQWIGTVNRELCLEFCPLFFAVERLVA